MLYSFTRRRKMDTYPRVRQGKRGLKKTMHHPDSRRQAVASELRGTGCFSVRKSRQYGNIRARGTHPDLSWTLRAPLALCIQFIIRLSVNAAHLKRTQSKCLPPSLPRGGNFDASTIRGCNREEGPPSKRQWSFIEGAERATITGDVFYDRLICAARIFLCPVIYTAPPSTHSRIASSFERFRWCATRELFRFREIISEFPWESTKSNDCKVLRSAFLLYEIDALNRSPGDRKFDCADVGQSKVATFSFLRKEKSLTTYR